MRSSWRSATEPEPEPERVQSTQQMGFEPIAACVAKFRGRPPPDLGEFALVRMQGLPDATGEGEPEADVHVPRRGRTHGLGHREEEWPVPERRVELRRDAEFFDGLAPDGAERMLAGLDIGFSRRKMSSVPSSPARCDRLLRDTCPGRTATLGLMPVEVLAGGRLCVIGEEQALLAPNAEGFSPQKTHRSPQLLSTFRANTFCPTRAAARITCSVCFSDQTPSLARWTIYGLLDALCS
jgi:hypothetical protein